MKTTITTTTDLGGKQSGTTTNLGGEQSGTTTTTNLGGEQSGTTTTTNLGGEHSGNHNHNKFGGRTFREPQSQQIWGVNNQEPQPQQIWGADPFCQAMDRQFDHVNEDSPLVLFRFLVLFRETYRLTSYGSGCSKDIVNQRQDLFTPCGVFP